MNIPFLRNRNTFTLTERTLLCVFAGILFVCIVFLLEKLNRSLLVTIPLHGGTLTEGMLGTPRFVNPLLATSEADKDLSALVYSGLMKHDSGGNLVTDLAQSYSVSPDGLTYTFILKPRAVFQDGTPVTADDVVYSVTEAEDASIQSPQAGDWNGIKVAKTNSNTVTFTLPKPYGFFLGNTTLGILPSHLWSKVAPADFATNPLNTDPVGSGPFAVSHVSRDSAGVATGYTLKSFASYAGGEPFIATLNFTFYASEPDLVQAYKDRSIESAYGLSTADASDLASHGALVRTAILPRIFGVFFNQKENPVFADKGVRVALDTTTDKDAVVSTILQGFGTTINGPLPQATATPLSAETEKDRIVAASAILVNDGWTKATSTGLWTKFDKKNPKNSLALSFSLSTIDTPEIRAAAQSIVDNWTALGANVDLHVYGSGDLNQNIIRPRKYDALFFGEVVGWQGDLYPFWDSAEANDPGLNIALYGNSKTDALLEKARETSDQSLRDANYATLVSDIENDTPAVFVYSPDLVYVIPDNLKGFALGHITEPAERLGGLSTAYIETEHIWKVFDHKTMVPSQ